MDDIDDYRTGSALFEAYRVNFNRFESLIAGQSSRLHIHAEEVRSRLSTATASIKEAASQLAPMGAGVNREAIERITEGAENITNFTMEGVREIGNVEFLLGWLHVMLVTFAEAYIEDVVHELLTRDLSPATLSDDLKKAITKNLTKQITRESPHQWVKSIKKLGLTGRDDAFMADLTNIWQQRHSIIHGPNSKPASMSPDEFKSAYQRVNAFLIHIDKQFVALLASTPPEVQA